MFGVRHPRLSPSLSPSLPLSSPHSILTLTVIQFVTGKRHLLKMTSYFLGVAVALHVLLRLMSHWSVRVACKMRYRKVGPIRKQSILLAFLPLFSL